MTQTKQCRSCGSTRSEAEMQAEGYITCCPERSMNEAIEQDHGVPALITAPAPADFKKPEPFILGNSYRQQDGKLVRFVKVHNEGTDYETMEDEDGVNRYTTRDFGRVTGSTHDYSDPRNTPPLYRTPPAYARIWEVDRLAGHLRSLRFPAISRGTPWKDLDEENKKGWLRTVEFLLIGSTRLTEPTTPLGIQGALWRLQQWRQGEDVPVTYCAGSEGFATDVQAILDHSQDLRRRGERLESALSTARYHAISWQGEPDEHSCKIHAETIHYIDRALAK